MISTKGYSVTTGYTTVLPANSSRRGDLGIQNNTSGTLYVTVGGSTTDADALQVPAGGFLNLSTPIGSDIKMKSLVAGNVTVVGDQLP